VLEIISGFRGGSIGSFILGAINLLVGLLLGSPVATALAVPFVFGLLLLIEGVALIVLAFRVRRAGRRRETQDRRSGRDFAESP
jgi:uncharacterized membrane protein HdeD (DUF308 family)